MDEQHFTDTCYSHSYKPFLTRDAHMYTFIKLHDNVVKMVPVTEVGEQK